MKNFLWIILLTMSSLQVSAQQLWNNSVLPSSSYKKNYSDTVYLVNGKKALDGKFKKFKLDFVLDARQTIISSTQARLLGLRVGLEYRRVNRFGIGFYNFGSGVSLTSLNEVDTAIVESVLNLSYTSLFYERVLYFDPKWEWSAAIHQGFGTISGWYRFRNDETRITFRERRVRPFEISTIGYYNLTWWCSIGGGMGYRFMRGTPAEVRPIFNSGVVIARVRIKFGKLARSLWDKDTKYEY